MTWIAIGAGAALIAVAAWWPEPRDEPDHHRASLDRGGWDALLVLSGGRPLSVLTRTDVLAYFTAVAEAVGADGGDDG